MKRNLGQRILYAITALLLLFGFTGCITDNDDEVIDIFLLDNPGDRYMTVGDMIYLNWMYVTESESYATDVESTGRYDLFEVKSSDTSVITVTGNNCLTAVGVGYTTITIDSKNSSASVWFEMGVQGKGGETKPSNTVSSIELSNPSLSLSVGEETYLSYTLYPFYAQNINTGVDCQSSNPSVATASYEYNSVYIKAIEEGSATITITSLDNPNVYTYCYVTVSDNYTPTYSVSRVYVSTESLSMDIGQTVSITAYTDKSAYPDIKWSSSNTSVATVSGGRIEAVGQGTATITATSKDNPSISATCTVSVSAQEYVEVTGLAFSISKLTLERGSEEEITVSVNPSGARANLYWSASNSCVSLTPDSEDESKCRVKGLTAGTGTIYVRSEDYSSVETSLSFEITNPATAVANKFFWGTWIRMDKGTQITIDDTTLTDNSNNKYEFLAKSTETELYLDSNLSGTSINKLEKKKNTANVIEAKNGDAVIPFYRKGGTDLNYSLKVVGFKDDGAVGNISYRAAASGMRNLKVRNTSNRFTSYQKEGITNDNGEVTLVAPVQGDVQTVSIETGDNRTVVIDNLIIENDGDYLGAIPIVDAKDYSLKITGEITNKTDGEYLYAGNTYDMILTVKNISEVASKPSVITIQPDGASGDSVTDSYMTLSSTDITTPLTATVVPTLKPGIEWKKHITIQTHNFSDSSYVDTKIRVELLNSKTGKTWQDYVPLRIFRKTTSITVSASESENPSACLNGFLIYPDGNNQFFSVTQGESKTLSVPLFKESERYTLVFSGATVEGNLDSSTELFYTVSLSDTEKPFSYTSIKNRMELDAIINFGEEGDEGNETEATAYEVNNDFEAYLSEGETDFYAIQLLSTTVGSSSSSPITITPEQDISFEGDWIQEGSDWYYSITSLPSGYAYHSWLINGKHYSAPSTGNPKIPASDFVKGVNELTLIVRGQDSRMHSCSKTIQNTH